MVVLKCVVTIEPNKCRLRAFRYCLIENLVCFADPTPCQNQHRPRLQVTHPRTLGEWLTFVEYSFQMHETARNSLQLALVFEQLHEVLG